MPKILLPSNPKGQGFSGFWLFNKEFFHPSGLGNRKIRAFLLIHYSRYLSIMCPLFFVFLNTSYKMKYEGMI